MGKTHRKRKVYFFEDEFEGYPEHSPKNRGVKEHNRSRERKRRERAKDDQASGGEEQGLYYLQRSKPY